MGGASDDYFITLNNHQPLRGFLADRYADQSRILCEIGVFNPRDICVTTGGLNTIIVFNV